MKLSPEQLATLYAAKDEIDKLLKSQGDDLPVGEYNVSGRTVTIKLNEGMTVEKVAGTNGDGTNSKTATQNLYGWGVITLLAQRLQRFNQWNMIRRVMTDAVRDAMQGNGTMAEELNAIDPEFAQQVELIRQECQPPARIEKAPRYVRRKHAKQRCMVKIES